MRADRLGRPVDEPTRNATLGWAIVAVLCALAVVHALESSYRWFAFTGFAVAIVLLPAVANRDPRAVPPWDLLLLVAIPVVDATVLGETFVTALATYVAVAAVALVAVVEIHRFTTVRMNHAFAVVLVVMTIHTDEIYLPPTMLFAFILLFVLAFGVVWELMEFALGLIADRLEVEALFAQHGIHDTATDLVYDLAGAVVVVATWGSVYLTDVSHRIAAALEG
ncbi:hypothetical protein ACFQGT_08105 [Natrialbaceae archaeon GCM10025810]|uniref:hypothetical protein n=1 Tax=Halovalidus salilacus TaxID=3075124 RepID=UPI00360875F4